MKEITGHQLMIMEWVFVAVAGGLVVIRFYARWRLRRNVTSWNDFFALLAWLCFLAQVIMDHVMYELRVFDEIENDQAEHVADQVTSVLALKVIYVSDASYYWNLYAVKASMLCFYTELVPATMKRTRLVLWLTIALVVAGFIITEAVLFLYCQPVWLNWTQDEDIACQTAWTIPGNAVPWAFHLLSDVLIYSIPIPVVRVVKLPKKQKIGVAITFGLGFVCIVFALATILSSWYSESATLEWIFACFEMTWAQFILCAPAFKFFLTKDVGKKIIGRVTGSWSRSRSNSRNRSRERSRSRISAVTSDQSATVQGGFSRLGSNTGDMEEHYGKDKACATDTVEMCRLSPQQEDLEEGSRFSPQRKDFEEVPRFPLPSHEKQSSIEFANPLSK